MAGGERTVKIKFTGESKGVDRAAANAGRSVKKLGDNVEKTVGGFGSKIAGGITSAIDSLPPLGKPIALALAAGLAVVLAPLVGAAITSAVLFAIGGGVLVAGIKQAAKNPRVKSAFGELKKTADSAFADLGKPFVEPLIRAAETFKGTVSKTIGPSLERMGKLLAPVIDKLAPALDKFFKNVMPGVESAVGASVPLFETLAEKLPGIGDAIGDFFALISENGDDTNQFFSDLLDIIESLIRGLGVVIGKLASWYSNVRSFLIQAAARFREFKVSAINELGRLLEAATAALGWIPGIGPKLKDANAKFRTFRAEANAELAKIKDREVRINAWSNIGSVVADVARQLASLGGGGGKKPPARRASGGPVSARRSYLVGENGPELLTMGSTGGNVTPNRELPGGGDVYELHVDLGNAVKQVIRFTNRDLKRRAGMRGAVA